MADVTERIQNDWPASRWDELIPWNWVRRPDAAPVGGMSAIDDMALSDASLEAWMAVKGAPARWCGPCRRWMALYRRRHGSRTRKTGCAHSWGCRATSWPKALQPIAPCLPVSPGSGLLLPILIYCVDKKGRPVLGKPRPAPETAHFIEHEACKDISLVVPALRELHYVTHMIRSDRRRRADKRAT